MIQNLQGAVTRANRAVALILGVALVLTVLFILSDVILRKLGAGSLGGSDEISGYVMAAVASWGMACALIERAHVRIDVIRHKLSRPGRAAMDLFAMIVTNATVILIAWHCWPVLQKTLERGSRANTPLETPLWIPQGIWFSGWVWFALCATVLTFAGIAHLRARRHEAFETTLGIGSEIEE
ncbi:TRAP transporter small permease [Paracoccus sp. Z330]|uniref:TRAP transporter small permease protein n=1 Tax=Paracoccus onchidii TaxID=3017813 RepID=A0ABT4ZCU1_9RHOB|nr:TRAP transporter small permease [Paracoccus onchidii]MDB6177179.1 TRAP transporter small permease [Paracoccus onchidii]